MADYIVNPTDPTSQPIIIHPKQVNGPGSVDANTSLRLFGEGHTSWGEAVNENFVRLLQNFASATSPAHPSLGQVWVDAHLYFEDTSSSTFYRYETDPADVGYATWKVISVTSSATAPVAPTIGSYWYDTNTSILKMFDSTDDGVPASWIMRSMELGTAAPSRPPYQVVKVYDTFSGGGTWNELTPAAILSDSTDSPSGDRVGTLRYSVATNTLYVWDGSAWSALVDAASPTFTGDINAGGFKVTNVADPVLGTDALNLQTGDLRYVNIDGDTMTGDLNLGGNKVNFGALVINEGGVGGDSTATGPDIRATDQLMLAAQTDVIATIDYDNNGSGDFVVSKGALTSGASVPLATIYNNGEIRAETASYETLVLDVNSITNKKYVDDKVDTVPGKHTVWVPSTAITPRATTGAGNTTFETTTNKVTVKTLAFDPATEEFAQFYVQMPKSWNESTVTARAVWSHSTGAVAYGVTWAISAVAFSSGDSLDVAFGTAQAINTVGGTANVLYRSNETADITIAGSPVAEDVVAFQISRSVADGGDTLGIDARLHGVVIYYNTDALNDA